MSVREKFFECIFQHDRNEYRFHVRAWTAAEAEEHIRASLRENGVREPGTLTIRDPKGAVLATSTYDAEAALG